MNCLALRLHKTTQKFTVQDNCAEKSSHAERLDRLRIAMQCTWAEVAEEIGLSESMIYQVKSGSRHLSPKAEHRLAVAERKEGLAPAIEQAVQRASSPEEAFSAFAEATAPEQIAILKRAPGLRNFWFGLQLQGMEEAIRNEIKQSLELANLAKSAAKKIADEKLQTEILDLAKSVIRRSKNLDLMLVEMFESIREIVSEAPRDP